MTDPAGPVAKECVEGYLFASPPLELLLFRRPPARGRIWVPVSGKVEPTDRDFPSALGREVEEETGLSLRPEELIDLDWHVPFRADNGETWRLHAFAVEVPRSFQPRLSPEHEAAEWVSAEEAVRRLHFEDNRAAVERLRERLPGRHPDG
ncbi:MAG TPA: NUDIX domain-containing protein [Thermoplasmata archaeon]